MAKVITLSRTFPAYHPKAGKNTFFVEQVLNALGMNKPYNSADFQNNLLVLNAKSIAEKKISPQDIAKFCASLNMSSQIKGKKLHTIRAKTVKKTGEVVSRWKQSDKASLRAWSGKPYNSPQIIIAPDVELVKVYEFDIRKFTFFINDKGFYQQHTSTWHSHMEELCENDGLSFGDLLSWFKVPCHFEGQILCWKEVDYV